MGKYMREDSDVISGYPSSVLRWTLAESHSSAYCGSFIYTESSINTYVSGVTLVAKPGTPVSLIPPINLETSSYLGLHPTWPGHLLSWRVSLCNLLIRVTQSHTSVLCLSLETDRRDWKTDRSFF